MKNRTLVERAAIWFDGIAATLLVVCGVALLYIAREEAAEEIRRRGRNIDHGAMEAFIAIAYLLPTAILFAIAVIAMARSWRFRWLAQGIAMFWLIGLPVIWFFVLLWTRHAR
jgi:hypothetical protein